MNTQNSTILLILTFFFIAACGDTAPPKHSPMKINLPCDEATMDCSSSDQNPGQTNPSRPNDGTDTCADCNDNDACTISTNSCGESCSYDIITSCVNGDGCCPAGCDRSNDSDCVNTCGNGILEIGEVCDGDCPTSCDDGDACTINGVSGQPDLCNVVCTASPVTSCVNGDGCCPAGCTSANDSDCACVPKTCAELGATCGSVSNGCGGTLNCGGCAGSATCQNSQCVAGLNSPIGGPCASNNDCAGDTVCMNNGDFPGGFCTQACQNDFGCESGTHCMGMAGYGQKFCAPNCQANNDCRQGGYACHDADGNGSKECAPAPLGNSPLGGACNGLPDCAGFADICLFDSQGFPGGYCTRECYFNGMCPYGSFCITNSQGPGYCAPPCASQTQCRANYECYLAVNEITGDEEGVCVP